MVEYRERLVQMKKLLSELKLFWLFGIKHNTGLAFHIAGGKVFMWMFGNILIVLIIALAWEVFEVAASLYKYGSWEKALIGTKYKTTKNWLMDSIGDVLGALFGAL